ncbi:carbohydrate ABC transporter permease [Streptomyces sp. SL13]|jgi:multiple sugar transport system permease protein|uniref:Carbohydrate ABC transporter permease n=1 Tax=Streptantibioticus silvisoli TaxID=2705255 RepID=A0AA90H7U8_9ACTN|nr:carbohydrate ABC transporter permease [Streptantibioticus silvisoli]MDI5963791.1 carbohydrate ABC transporter permease [Streptantibioticus silvisoli]MDI5972826.1 carbohydrate ABC transporter permease [Streptantibioticus silvisoli]
MALGGSASTALGLRAPRALTEGPGARRAGRAARVVVCLIVVAVFVLPLWSMIATALSSGTSRLGQMQLIPQDFGLGNVETAWREGMGKGLFNSAVMEVFGLSLQLAVSSMAAYALARKRFRGAAAVMVLIMATMMMPDEVIAIPLYLIIGKIPQPFGGGTLLNSYGGLILPLVGWALPIYILTAFMRQIPLELEEAARVDGAGDVWIFLRIIVPLCKPALATCAVFGFLMIWDQYLLPLLVVQSPSLDPLTVVVTSLQSSEELGDGVKLAAATILMVPSVLFYLCLQRLFERGMLSGSLKG